MRLSILIPNYNNGRQSSRDGETDFITDLLQSLHDTLHDDPTSLEIIAYDDGSTDDSLDTLRQWSQKTWRNGQPFVTLIEAPHCGVLAKTANVMVERSKGEFLARLDGDTVMLTRHWAAKVCAVFDSAPPRLGVVGPKQLRPDMRIHAYGDWLLHPKGYHHLAAGCERHAVTTPLEVDHVMGCFYCCRRKVHVELGGYDENILRGQTIDFGLRARLHGWSCIAVPHIEYIHRHGLRVIRATKADSPEGVKQTLDTFRQKWGFDRIAPDLDIVRQRYAGTPLLWNARVFGMPPEVDAARTPATLDIQQTEWARFSSDTGTRAHVEFRTALAKQVVQQIAPPSLVAQVGCGPGLLAHLLAQQGLPMVGIDQSEAAISLANQCVRNQTYRAEQPRFVHQPEARTLPLADESADLVLVFDQLHKHPNPTVLLHEVNRVLRQDGLIIVTSPRPTSALAAHLGLESRYLLHELMSHISAVGGYSIVNDPAQDRNPQHPLVVIAKRTTPSAEQPVESLAATAATP